MVPLHSTRTDSDKMSQRKTVSYATEVCQCLRCNSTKCHLMTLKDFETPISQFPCSKFCTQSARKKPCGLNCGSLFISLTQNAFNGRIFQNLLTFFWLVLNQPIETFYLLHVACLPNIVKTVTFTYKTAYSTKLL